MSDYIEQGLGLEGTVNAVNAALAPQPPLRFTLSADSHNYNPGGNQPLWLMNLSTDRVLTGIALTTTPVDGQTHLLVNIGNGVCHLRHDDTNSVAGNRFAGPNAANVDLVTGAAVWLVRDASISRWRIVVSV